MSESVPSAQKGNENLMRRVDLMTGRLEESALESVGSDDVERCLGGHDLPSPHIPLGRGSMRDNDSQVAT